MANNYLSYQDTLKYAQQWATESGGATIDASAFLSIEQRAIVLSDWIDHRLEFVADTGDFIDSCLSRVASVEEGISSAELADLDRCGVTLEDGRLVQFEPYTALGQTYLRIWIGENYDEYILRLNDSGKYILNGDLGIPEIQGLAEVLASTNDDVQDTLMTCKNGLSMAVNSGGEDVSSWSATLKSTCASAQEIMALVAATPADKRAGVVAQYITDTLVQTFSAVSMATESDNDAGAFSVSDYQSAKTVSIIAGAWTAMSQLVSGIGTLLVIVGTPLLKAVGVAVTAGTKLVNWIKEKRDDIEYVHVNDDAKSSEFANAFRIAMRSNYNHMLYSRLSGGHDFMPASNYSWTDNTTTAMLTSDTTYGGSGNQAALLYPKVRNTCIPFGSLHRLFGPEQTTELDIPPRITCGSIALNMAYTPSDSTNIDGFVDQYGTFTLGIRTRSREKWLENSAYLANTLNDLQRTGVATTLANELTKRDTTEEAFDEHLSGLCSHNAFLTLFNLASSSQAYHDADSCAGRFDGVTIGHYDDHLVFTFPRLFLDGSVQGCMTSLGLFMDGYDREDIIGKKPASASHSPQWNEFWGPNGRITWIENCASSKNADVFGAAKVWARVYLPRALAYGNMRPIPGSAQRLLNWDKLYQLMEEPLHVGARGVFPDTDTEMVAYFKTHPDDVDLLTIADLVYMYFLESLEYLRALATSDTVMTRVGANAMNSIDTGSAMLFAGAMITLDTPNESLTYIAPCYHIAAASAWMRRSWIIDDPYITPPRAVRGSVVLGIVLGAAAVVATAVIAVTLGRRIRNGLRGKVVRREQAAIQAESKLRNADPSDPNYKQLVSDYVKAQRRFQRYAGLVGYSSNTVGSFGTPGYTPTLLASIRDGMSQYNAVDTTPIVTDTQTDLSEVVNLIKS